MLDDDLRNRAFRTDTGAGPAVDTVQGDRGLAALDPDRFRGADFRARPAPGAVLYRNYELHITTVCNHKPCTYRCQ